MDKSRLKWLAGLEVGDLVDAACDGKNGGRCRGTVVAADKREVKVRFQRYGLPGDVVELWFDRTEGTAWDTSPLGTDIYVLLDEQNEEW